VVRFPFQATFGAKGNQIVDSNDCLQIQCRRVGKRSDNLDIDKNDKFALS
jgi:hypothetical protein